MPNYSIKSPESNEEWESYLLFRWEVLRKPLGMSKESLADSIEDSSFHLMGIDERENVIADQAKGLAPYFTEYVRRTMEKEDDQLGVNIYRDGLKIHTTLDSRLQILAEE